MGFFFAVLAAWTETETALMPHTHIYLCVCVSHSLFALTAAWPTIFTRFLPMGMSRVLPRPHAAAAAAAPPRVEFLKNLMT